MTTEVKAAVDAMNEAFAGFVKRNDQRIVDLETNVGARLDTLSDAIDRVNGASRASSPGELDGVYAALGEFAVSGNPSALTKASPRGAMTVESNPDGGYAVPPEMTGELIRRIQDVSPVRQVARISSTTSDEYQILGTSSFAGGAWVGETDSRADTATPGLLVNAIKVHEQYCQPKASQKLLDSAIYDIGTWLVEEGAENFGAMEGLAFVSGDGVLKPRGFTTYTTSSDDDPDRDVTAMQYVPTGNATAFKADPDGPDAFIDIIQKSRPRYRRNAVWMMNSATLAAVRKMQDSNGSYLFQPSMLAGEPDRILGYRVVVAEDMADLGAGAFPVAFGDFSQGYRIVDHAVGLSLLRDPYTDKPNVRFYMTRRVGGAVVDFNAIKLLKCATS